MMLRRIKLILLIAFALGLAACSPTIGNRAKIQDVKFEIGKTTKQEVAEVLGLPAAIQKDEKTSSEFWAYNDKPELTGVMWAAPTAISSSSVTVTTWDTPVLQGHKEFKDAALICVFDNTGTLSQLKQKE